MPLTPTQESLLENWLRKHREPVDLRISQAPAEGKLGEAREPMPLTPTQNSLLENWSKEPVDLRKRKPPGVHPIRARIPNGVTIRGSRNGMAILTTTAGSKVSIEWHLVAAISNLNDLPDRRPL